MKTLETKHQHVFESYDNRGIFQFRIQKDLSQIQLETEMDGFGIEDYVDVNLKEVMAIRDMLTKAIEARLEATHE